tara:strand:+ start:1749 stop:2021 length:273 start_codon:yes stop_codon:yes gene_type:complete
MKLYQVTDFGLGDINDTYFADKKTALRAAQFRAGEDIYVHVDQIDIGKVDRAKVLQILNGGQYVSDCQTIWQSEYAKEVNSLKASYVPNN